MIRNEHDQWSGTQATTQRTIVQSPPHNAYLQLHLGQVVTLVSRPLWCWHDESLLSGTCVVAASTYNHSNEPTTPDHATSEQAPMALLGVVQLYAFLP